MPETLAYAHKLVAKKRYKEAAVEYEKALNDPGLSEKDLIISFQNCGACLRRSEQNEKSITILKQGIKEYPDAASLYQNLGACYKEQKENPKGKWIALSYYLKARSLGLQSAQLTLALVGLLNELSFPSLAYSEYREWLNNAGAKHQIDQQMISALLELMGTVLNQDDAKRIGEWCLDNLGDLAGETLAGQSILAIYKAKLGQTSEAKTWFGRAKDGLLKTKEPTEQEQQAFINAGWNLSIALLKSGDMEEGWRLFDFGLQAPASGAQRWQRSLAKPLHGSQLPIWQGENLKGKRLLILAEQAVGDTMMFLQLINHIRIECPQLTLMVQPRLVPIYKRMYPELTVLCEEENNTNLRADKFDFQIPCGSLPQHFLSAWLSNGWQQEVAPTNKELSKKLLEKYREGLDEDTPIIGVSWMGGGKRERIRNKSLPEDLFAELFRTEQRCRFVSLQYGNARNQVDIWRTNGIDIIYDETIDPLSNMDDWMAQVSTCDAVISVANTTIHGAGMLKIPTLCLRSRNSDWRWVNKLSRSYWYSSVEASTQSQDGEWQSCLDDAKKWLGQRKRLKDIDRAHSDEKICDEINKSIEF